MTDHTPLYQTPASNTTPPPSVAAWFDGTDLEGKVGTAIGVLTTDPDGWPHSAQLSPGEILLPPDGEVRLALHAHSSTTENLRRDGHVVLIFAADGANHELRFEVTERARLTAPPLATFSGRLLVAREHRVPYANVVSGVRFTLHDTGGTLDRWRRQIDALHDLDDPE
jgi:hypothetical protein